MSKQTINLIDVPTQLLAAELMSRFDAGIYVGVKSEGVEGDMIYSQQVGDTDYCIGLAYMYAARLNRKMIVKEMDQNND